MRKKKQITQFCIVICTRLRQLAYHLQHPKLQFDLNASQMHLWTTVCTSSWSRDTILCLFTVNKTLRHIDISNGNFVIKKFYFEHYLSSIKGRRRKRKRRKTKTSVKWTALEKCKQITSFMMQISAKYDEVARNFYSVVVVVVIVVL